MFQEICADILNQKIFYVEQMGFPLNAKKIAAMEGFSSSIRQFFFAEINYYCNQIMQLLTKNTNVSIELLNNEDNDHLTSILYDWIEFNEEQTHLILTNAIQTELFFLINPAKCLSMFLYKKNNETTNERKIEEIITEFDFITDTHNIISSLKNELLELANAKNTLSDTEFNNLANDVVFNIIHRMEITDLLYPLKIMQEILCDENIPLELIDIFFYEYDLAGVLTKIKEYATNNEKDSLNYDEIVSIINETMENTDTNNMDINDETQAENIDTPADLEEIENPDAVTVEAENIDTPTDLDEYLEEIENPDAVTVEAENIDAPTDLDKNISDIENSDADVVEAENIDIPADLDEYLEEIENPDTVTVEAGNIDIPADLDEYLEEIENEVDNTIAAIEELEPQVDDATPINENSEYNSQESISDAIIKMRTDGLTYQQIESAYLELENEFLINLKAKLLG